MIMEQRTLQIGNFSAGLVTRVPATDIPDNAFSDVQNIELDDKFVSTKVKGHYKYNYASLDEAPVRGGFCYVMTDGTKYYVAACGNKLYYSIAGSGVFETYKIDGEDVILPDDCDIEIVQYLNSLWIVNGKYPVIQNENYSNARLLRIEGTNVSVLSEPAIE